MSGVTLQKCSGCSIEIYCVRVFLALISNLINCDDLQSKECQKKAWPSHKVKCKLNQKLNSGPSEQADTAKILRAFTTKHRPIFTESVIRAFDLRLDPTRCTREVLQILLMTRPESTRTETSFVAIDANVVSIDSLGQQGEEMRGQLALTNEQLKGRGSLGVVFVMLMCLDKHVSNIVGVGFDEDIYGLPTGLPWKENLLTHLNEGIVT